MSRTGRARRGPTPTCCPQHAQQVPRLVARQRRSRITRSIDVALDSDVTDGEELTLYARERRAVELTSTPSAEDVALGVEPDGGDHPDPAGDAAWVGALLARLTPRQRDAIQLLADGHSYRGIAAELGVAPSAAERLVARARARLARYADTEAPR